MGHHLAHVQKKYLQILAGTMADTFGYQSPWYRSIQNMGPRAMDHPCEPSPWTPLWTQSIDYTCGPPLIFVDEFYQRSRQILGTLNDDCGQFLLSGLWAPHILHMFNFFFNSIPM